jgi:hypothetical protein
VGHLAEEPEEDTAADEEDDDQMHTRPNRAGQRNIPTWEETIRGVVDSNIEARSSRGAAGRSGGRPRGRGGSGGRGRHRG